ncbi:MAG TPA: VOC family protein [Gammaproteobacteria bacterium]|jgi:PhnB protein
MAKKKPHKKPSAKKPARKKKAAAKRRAKATAVPKGYHSVTAYLAVRGARAAIDFYVKAFGAKELSVFQDGARIAHAELRIGDARLNLADENTELGFNAPPQGQVSSTNLLLYLKDADGAVERAVAGGAKLERPVADQFYGDRLGVIVDAFGYRWYVATHIEDVSDKELMKRMKAMETG